MFEVVLGLAALGVVGYVVYTRVIRPKMNSNGSGAGGGKARDFPTKNR